MHNRIQAYLASLRSDAVQSGIGTHELEIERALNFIGDDTEICCLLSSGFDIANAQRVVFSSKVHWIDVFIELCSREVSKYFVITFDSINNELVSLSRSKRVFSTNTGSLPFSLNVKSHTVDVIASNEDIAPIQSRREAFSQLLVAALIPVMSFVSPAMASTTNVQSNPQTCSNTSEQTSHGTSGLTTPNDNDTLPDTNTDNHEDCRTDSQTDTRDDP